MAIVGCPLFGSRYLRSAMNIQFHARPRFMNHPSWSHITTTIRIITSDTTTFRVTPSQVHLFCVWVGRGRWGNGCNNVLSRVFVGCQHDVIALCSGWKYYVIALFSGWKCYVIALFSGWKCYVIVFCSGWKCYVIERKAKLPIYRSWQQRRFTARQG